jgi:Bifunctional DNA primase/polymerase, N-terminal/Primase C terminal 1 (PriCT-1)
MDNKKSLEGKGLLPQGNGVNSTSIITENPNKLYRSALTYAKKFNWPVFPIHSIVNGQCTCKKDCNSPGKHPVTAKGFHAATTDLSQIKKWWTEHPEANIGIPTGEKSGFIAVDIDPRHGGNESFKDLTDKYGELPETIEAITGGGGRHILFKHIEGVGNKANVVPGIDIRGNGGYIVVAPSIHSSGRAYEWELSSHPANVSLADMPEWLLHIIGNPKQDSKKPVEYWKELLQGVGDGERNMCTASLSGYLLRYGIDPHIALELVLLWNLRNTPPEEKEVIKTTFNSILKAEIKRRKGAGA